MKTIAVDVDDTLAASAEGFVAFSNEHWGTRFSPEDYDEDWAKMWDVSLEESEERVRYFYEHNIFPGYRKLEEAEPVLVDLAKDYRLVIVTSRRREIVQTTHDWLDEHFPNLFQEVHFAGMFDVITEASRHTTKREICQTINASYLIDDQVKHCNAVSEGGIGALLYGDYEWNRNEHLLSGVERTPHWQAVREYFYG